MIWHAKQVRHIYHIISYRRVNFTLCPNHPTSDAVVSSPSLASAITAAPILSPPRTTALATSIVINYSGHRNKVESKRAKAKERERKAINYQAR
jgi:hypothetical protein